LHYRVCWFTAILVHDGRSLTTATGALYCLAEPFYLHALAGDTSLPHATRSTGYTATLLAKPLRMLACCAALPPPPYHNAWRFCGAPITAPLRAVVLHHTDAAARQRTLVYLQTRAPFGHRVAYHAARDLRQANHFRLPTAHHAHTRILAAFSHANISRIDAAVWRALHAAP